MNITEDKPVTFQVNAQVLQDATSETDVTKMFDGKAVIMQIAEDNVNGDPAMVDLPLSAFGDFRNKPSQGGDEKAFEVVYFNTMDSLLVLEQPGSELKPSEVTGKYDLGWNLTYF